MADCTNYLPRLCTANISAVLSTVNCGVTFPTVIWQYSKLQMAELRDADGSNRNSLLSSAALSTVKLLSET